MRKQDFEDILTGPQDLTQDNLRLLLEYSRREKSSVEYKQEFDREQNGKLKLIDFCKVIIGFLNSESDGSVLMYGIDNAIVNSSDKDVSEFIIGHNLIETRIEDLVGYVKERVWPAEVWIIHIKQLPISENKAVTTIYVGKGRSKPYLYYQPNNPGNGIRSFQRGSAGTYELEAPQLHQFINQTSGLPVNELNREKEDISKSKSTNRDSILKDNFDDISKVLKDPKQFGLFTICIEPSERISVADSEIENLLDPMGSRRGQVMEELWYALSFVPSQKWYRRILVPTELKEENKGTWAITCYRKTGFLIVNGLVDEYLQGKKYLHPFSFSYQLQRILQMAKTLYKERTQSVRMTIDFKYIETFGYVSFLYGRNEKIHPYVAFSEPIEREIKSENIYSDSKADVLLPDVIECMKEVARIFGLIELPDSLVNKQGEMIYVESFKGMR